MADTNNNKILNVPPLRFPEFSGEWEKQKLSDFVERVTRKNKNNESKLPLTISAQYGLVDQITFFNKVIASADISGYYLLKKGEFAYNKSYSGDYTWGAVKRLDRYEQGALSTLYICFSPLKCVISDYLVHYFETKKWHREVSEIAVEGARNHGLLNIGVADYFNTKHFLPTKKEQKKIAAFLNLIEKRIALQTKIIEDLKTLKSALYHLIFSTIDNEFTSLGKIASIVKGTQVNGTELLDEGDYYVMNGGIQPSGYYDKYNVPANTISISEGGNSCGYVQYNTSPFWSGGHCYTIQKIDSSIITEFLYHYLKYKEPEIMKLRIGSGLPNIQKKDLECFPIVNIPLQEQKEIVELFNMFETKEINESKILSLLQKQKSYLLGEMFI